MDDGTKRVRCRRYRCRQGQGGCVHSLVVSTADVPEQCRGAACAGLLAKPRRALSGPSFTSCPFRRELVLRPARLDPDGLRPVTR